MRGYHHQRKIWHMGLTVVGILLVSALLSWGVNAMFTIRSVEVVGEGVRVSVDPEKMPRNLLFFPVERLKNELLRGYPLIAEMNITKKYPGTLVISATLRAPKALVGAENTLYAIDKEGVVLEEYPEKMHLPKILIDVPPVPSGKRVTDTRILAALSFLLETEGSIAITRITSGEGDTLQATDGVMNILFPQKSDIPAIVRTLQTMLVGFRIKGKLPSTIDLRFDKPVVTF